MINAKQVIRNFANPTRGKLQNAKISKFQAKVANTRSKNSPASSYRNEALGHTVLCAVFEMKTVLAATKAPLANGSEPVRRLTCRVWMHRTHTLPKSCLHQQPLQEQSTRKKQLEMQNHSKPISNALILEAADLCHVTEKEPSKKTRVAASVTACVRSSASLFHNRPRWSPT